MTEATPPPDPTLDDLRRDLARLAQIGSPQVATLARWASDHPEEMAFHSVRRLAEVAGVNANTAFRLAVALGFQGFEPCRQAFQAALRQTGGRYALRATQLSGAAPGDLMDNLENAAAGNIATLFQNENRARLTRACDLMLGARHIVCVGVRSCLSLAHYLAYTGHMGFAGFSSPVAEPGGIADAVAATGPEDVAVLISFSLYSMETVRAHDIARKRGAQIIAITDSFNAPIARDARVVLTPPMEGPQTLPSMAAAFALAEVLVAEMVARSPEAPGRISEFENRLLASGVYMG